MHAVLLYCITHDLSRFTFRTKLGRVPLKETVSNEPFYIYFFFLKTLHTRVKFCWPTANLAYSLYGVFPGLLGLYISVTDHVRPETCWPRRLLRPLGLGRLQTDRNRGFRSFPIRIYAWPRSNFYLPRKFEWMNSFYTSEQFAYFKIPKQLHS